MYRPFALALSLSGAYVASQTLPDPLICEDSIDGQTTYISNDTPCVLECDGFVVHATGSLLPDSVNSSAVPYCILDCLYRDATPTQSALASGCHSSCLAKNGGNPEDLGWCMYWCLDGYGDLVTTTSCVPSIAYGSPTVTVIDGVTETVERIFHESCYLEKLVRNSNSYFENHPGWCCLDKYSAYDNSSTEALRRFQLKLFKRR
ncbi:hypothetical protein VP1G_01787 [Cytospora mali]|uniref:Uncharacterized protein n=1 Tax=Cytospora mali TaxID=578113 RepID=A0A194URQ1_CYTMA|nr:hypothetical protein VP1G_01787 [Valsa mali var. pyri (nom. inval.)]